MVQKKQQKLFRSQTDSYIGGVCGGFAQRLGIDSLWVRLIALLLFFFDGIGFVLYIIFWIALPLEPQSKKTVTKTVTVKKKSSKKEH